LAKEHKVTPPRGGVTCGTALVISSQDCGPGPGPGGPRGPLPLTKGLGPGKRASRPSSPLTGPGQASRAGNTVNRAWSGPVGPVGPIDQYSGPSRASGPY